MRAELLELCPLTAAAAHGDLAALKAAPLTSTIHARIDFGLSAMGMHLNILDTIISNVRAPFDQSNWVENSQVSMNMLCSILRLISEKLPPVVSIIVNMEMALNAAYQKNDWLDFDLALNKCEEFRAELCELAGRPIRAALNAAIEGGHHECAQWLIGVAKPEDINFRTVVSAHISHMWAVVKWAAAHLGEANVVHDSILSKAWSRLVQRNYAPPDEDPLIFGGVLGRHPELLMPIITWRSYKLLAKYWPVHDRSFILVGHLVREQNMDPLTVLKFEPNDLYEALEQLKHRPLERRLVQRELRATTHLRNPALVYLLKRLPIAAGPAADIYELCEGNLLRGVRAQRDLAYAAM